MTVGGLKLGVAGPGAMAGHVLGKNPGDVAELSTSNFRGDHRATFPVALADRMIRAGCPELRSRRSRTPWRRGIVQRLGQSAIRGALAARGDWPPIHGQRDEPGLVLDSFIGSGTTAVAADALSRERFGIELNLQSALIVNAGLTAERRKRQTEQRLVEVKDDIRKRLLQESRISCGSTSHRDYCSRNRMQIVILFDCIPSGR